MRIVSRMFVLCLTCVVVLSSTANAQDVFIAGLNLSGPDLLHSYDLDGTFVQSTPASLNSLATDGRSIFAGSRTSILQFDRFGNEVGTFAEIKGGGDNIFASNVETDASNNVYIAFEGFNSKARTSFRLDSMGNVTASYSHPDLVFPDGIDATPDGTTWIANGAAVGVGNRLFSFDSDGNYLADFAIPEVDNPSSIAIIDSSEELVVADEFQDALHFYDISSGVPLYVETIEALNLTSEVYIDQSTDRIFAAASLIGGFEIDREGNILTEYLLPPPANTEFTFGIVAFTAVPEPSGCLICLTIGITAITIRRK